MPGDRVTITFTDDPARPVTAVICSVLSDQQEGLSPEIEDYVAYWLKVSWSTCEKDASCTSRAAFAHQACV